MSDKQQSAVDWLEGELRSHCDMKWQHYKEIFDQAKELFKQQIIDAIDETNEKWRSQKAEIILSGKQYFNETFKTESNG